MDFEHASSGVDRVIITRDLDRRSSRAPDYKAENQALAFLAETMGGSPGTVLQRLVELAMELTRCDSAGVSLLEGDGEQATFRWVATAGAWAPYRDGTMPREESPCGEVIARESVLLMDRPERAFPALLQAQPGIVEGLLAPFTIDGAPAGTLWAVMHGQEGRFESEDARLIESLARFASTAHQMVRSLGRAEVDRLGSDTRLRALARASSDVFYTMSPDMTELRALSGGDFIANTTSPSLAWLQDYIPADDQARTVAATTEAIRTKGVFELEHRVRQVDGRIGWALSRAVPILGTDGEIVEWFGAASDITARKQSEERQAFLLRFSDALRAEPSAEAIANRALRMLSEQMRLDRCYVGVYRLAEDIGEFPQQVHNDRLPPLPAQVRLSDFPEALRVAFDRTLVVNDVSEMEGLSDSDRASFHGLGLRALIAATLRKGKNNPLWAIVAVSTCARVWTQGEISLVEEAAERTWAAVERAGAEGALRDSEERYLGLFNAIDQGFCVVEMAFDENQNPVDYRLLEISPAFERQTGIKDGAGRWMREIAPEQDQHWFDIYGRIALTGEPARFENFSTPLGRWWEVYAFRVTGLNRVAILFRDITDHKRAEETLRDSEARLAAAFESVPIGTAVIDTSGAVVMANQEYRRFLPSGIMPSRDPKRGSRWRGWDAQGRLLESADFPGARALRGEHVVPGQQMLYTDDDGREIWTSVASVPTRNASGQVTGLVSAITDIDDLKRSAEALRDSEARFRQFSDASTSILWIRNAATMRMEFASPASDTIYGIPGPERGGDPSLRTWARLIEPESRKDVLANFRRVRNGERVEVEFRIKRASDGALRWVHSTDFPLRDAAGNVRWLAGLGADITDAKEAGDRQGVLVAELQHRTRNLIAVVRSLSDRTLGNAGSLEDFAKRFRPRLAALSRVQGLLSHLAAGERVTFKELLEAELAAHGVADGQASKLTLDGPADVPLRSATVQTFALALHELATNAVKYGAFAALEGHLTVRWRVEPASDDDPPQLYVEWREMGVSMPQVGAPARGGGYGRELIERALPYQLKAKTSYELGADGVRCTIAVPISRATIGAPDDE